MFKSQSLRKLSLSAIAARRFYSSLPSSVSVTLPNGIKYEQPTGLFINNEWVPSKKGRTFPVINPSTEEEITQVYEATEEDVEVAIDAAEARYNSDWSTMDPLDRGLLLHKLANLMEQHAEVLVGIESLDNGKTLKTAEGDVAYAITCIRSIANLATNYFGRQVIAGASTLAYTRREPLGVCGQIIPWNFPILMWSWKIAPALVTGNTVVMKPAEMTPLSALYASQLVKEAGFPAGAYNCVQGMGSIVGEHLSRSERISKVAFTGSTATGKRIMRNAADTNLKKVTLELGGKSPNIVFDDADLDLAVQNILVSIFINAGQICCAGSRLYVQEGIRDKLVKKLVAAVEDIKVGDPFDPSVTQGAMTSKKQFDKVMSYIDAGKSEGATVLTGGVKSGDKGFFIRPTIFTDIKEDMKVVKDEIFGPVLVMDTFKTIDEVVAKANNTNYGLASGVHTTNLKNAVDVSNKLKAGTVWVNCYNANHYNLPFGGYKQSGQGRECGPEVLENYLQVKSVRMEL